MKTSQTYIILKNYILKKRKSSRKCRDKKTNLFKKIQKFQNFIFLKIENFKIFDFFSKFSKCSRKFSPPLQKNQKISKFDVF